MRTAVLATPSAAAEILEARRAGRSIVLVDPRLPEPEQRRRAALADGSDERPSAVVFTSGTTMAARAVVLPWEELDACAAAVVRAVGLRSGDRWLCPLPLAHVGGLSVLLRCDRVGADAVLVDGFDAADLAAELALGTTHVSLVGRMLARLLGEPNLDAPRLRLAMVGGGPTDPGLIARAREAGIPAVTTYGLTEACSTVTLGRLDALPTTAGDAGWPIPGRTVSVVDGRIRVRGAGLAWGTVDEPRTGDSLVSGDHGRMEPDGRLVVLDRRLDRIVTGGENVAPAQVERALVEAPGVREICVVGVPDPEWGQRVVAVVRWDDDPQPAALRERAAGLVAWQRPKQIVDWEGPLPRTALGKLQRAVIRDALLVGENSGSSAP